MFGKLIGADGDVSIQSWYYCDTYKDCWNAPFNYEATYRCTVDSTGQEVCSFYRCGC